MLKSCARFLLSDFLIWFSIIRKYVISRGAPCLQDAIMLAVPNLENRYDVCIVGKSGLNTCTKMGGIRSGCGQTREERGNVNTGSI